VEFSLICPVDGLVDLGLEHIAAVVLHDPDAVDVVFTCPHCGETLQATLRVPNLMNAAMQLASHIEQVAVDPDLEVAPGDLSADRASLQNPHEDSYCEYFRRQLAHVESVEDLLAEIDGR